MGREAVKRAATTLAAALVVALGLSVACGPGHRSSSCPTAGAAARELLTQPITIEVFPIGDHAPSDAAIALLTKRAGELGAGVAGVVTHAAIAPARSLWTQGDLLLLERDHSPIDDPARVGVIYAPGYLLENRAAGGVTVSEKSVAIFTDALKPWQEPPALLHEWGHLVGLVTNRAHADPSSERHDADSLCVMFRWVTGADDFCALCKQDLEGLRR